MTIPMKDALLWVH